MAHLEDTALEQVQAEVKLMISEIIEIPEDEIPPDASFVEDLNVDSLMALEIIANIEKKYRIEIPEENLERVKTLNDTIDLVREFLNGQVQ